MQARVEALRLAWHDRLQLLGDPKHADVPVEQLALGEVRAGDARSGCGRALKAGKPVEAASDGRPAGGTIHLNAVDATGLMVALTFTHGEAFGAQVTVDGLGPDARARDVAVRPAAGAGELASARASGRSTTCARRS